MGRDAFKPIARERKYLEDYNWWRLYLDGSLIDRYQWVRAWTTQLWQSTDMREQWWILQLCLQGRLRSFWEILFWSVSTEAVALKMIPNFVNLSSSVLASSRRSVSQGAENCTRKKKKLKTKRVARGSSLASSRRAFLFFRALFSALHPD